MSTPIDYPLIGSGKYAFLDLAGQQDVSPWTARDFVYADRIWDGPGGVAATFVDSDSGGFEILVHQPSGVVPTALFANDNAAGETWHRFHYHASALAGVDWRPITANVATAGDPDWRDTCSHQP